MQITNIARSEPLMAVREAGDGAIECWVGGGLRATAGSRRRWLALLPIPTVDVRLLENRVRRHVRK